jgi:hypothetical protein
MRFFSANGLINFLKAIRDGIKELDYWELQSRNRSSLSQYAPSFPGEADGMSSIEPLGVCSVSQDNKK